MKPNTIIQGHVLDVLATMPDDHFQAVITSPPYWGLRDYGIEPVIWGGDRDCRHDWQQLERPGMTGGTAATDIGGWAGGNRGRNTTFKNIVSVSCVRCNAWRGCLGLEPTLEGDWVLDPFAGIGTTVRVAKFSGRKGVGIEISPEYVEIANRKLSQGVLL